MRSCDAKLPEKQTLHRALEGTLVLEHFALNYVVFFGVLDARKGALIGCSVERMLRFVSSFSLVYPDSSRAIASAKPLINSDQQRRFWPNVECGWSGALFNGRTVRGLRRSGPASHVK